MNVSRFFGGKQGILLILGVVITFAVILILFDGLIRVVTDQPQIWESHVRYTWLDKKTGERQCVVAVRGKPAGPCSDYSPQEIQTMRLNYETPRKEVLEGKF